MKRHLVYKTVMSLPIIVALDVAKEFHEHAVIIASG